MEIIKRIVSPAQVKLTITLTPEELRPFLVKAAEALATEHPFAGFRPGKAPYDIVKQQLGEMTIYRRSIDNAISKTLFAALEKEMPNAEVVGQPQVDIEKLAPANPLIYVATITLLPEVVLPDISKIKVDKKEVKADPAEVQRTLDMLCSSRVIETASTTPLAKGDKAVVALTVAIDHVVIEGGSHPNYPLVIGESHFIPGFEEQLVGMKAGEKKEFKLSFPKGYHEKNLAGKLADFTVEVKETFARQLPEINDAFATNFGQKTAVDLKALIEGNAKTEAEAKEHQRQELAMLDALVAKATFSDLPETLVEAESHRMVHELEHSIEQQGLKFADYLAHLKKTEDELRKDFHDDAKKRVQVALAIQAVAKTNNLTVAPEAIDAEVAAAAAQYAQNPEVMENVKSASYRRYVANTLLNRQVIAWLRDKILTPSAK
ncbi:MAG: trigger factor [Patescibacteria group bacterium]